MTRTALVTGGARGIGYGIATALAREGANIAVMDIQPPDTVAENMDKLREFGIGALYCQADVSKAAGRAAAMDAVEREFGCLNVLVNNAGIAPKVRADILDAAEESFELLMRVNLQGPYFLTQAAANHMISRQKLDPTFSGCIVNISSISATVASPSRGEYCISKAGVSMATLLWATRLGEFNIPVYEIRPGVIKTPMTAVVTDKYDKLIADGLCLQERWGMPEDIGKAVAMLARGDLPYSTGQVIMIDGGMTVQRL